MKKQGILITLTLIAIVAIVGGITVSNMKKNTIAPTTTSLTPTPDTDLDKDVQDIDSKLKALNADAGSIDQSLNDQQGNLSEQ